MQNDSFIPSARQHYLPQKTMSCSFLLKAISSGGQIWNVLFCWRTQRNETGSEGFIWKVTIQKSCLIESHSEKLSVGGAYCKYTSTTWLGKHKCVSTKSNCIYIWYLVWMHGLGLARQVLYHLNHTPSPFCALVIFQVWSHSTFRTSLRSRSSSYVPHVAGLQVCTTTPGLFVEIGSC
jgi:hypothetical protein